MHKRYFLLLVFGLSRVAFSLGNDSQSMSTRRGQLLSQNVDYVQKRMTGRYEGITAYVPLYDFKNKNLRGVNLRCLNFWFTDFEGADLSGVLLQGASFLRSTKLRGAILRGVNFEGIYINHTIHSPEITKEFFRRAGAIVA
jgi:uncharacterized protein YjbI with pentapeptide repeats